MFHDRIRSVDFSEHPATDLHARRAGIFDVLMNFDFQDSNDQTTSFPMHAYCSSLLQKICTLSNVHLRSFIDYQVQLMKEPTDWLNALDELIVLNAEMFDTKLLLLRAEKAMLIIESTLQDLRRNNYRKTNSFDLEKVRAHLQTLANLEEQITYLYSVRAKYLQSPSPPLECGEIPFDQKIMIEVDRVHKLMESLKLVKKSAKTVLEEKYIVNEDFMLIMKISKRTAQTWRDIRLISYIQIQKKIYYLLEDVEALLKKNYVGALKR
jgi:hypothetical protein